MGIAKVLAVVWHTSLMSAKLDTMLRNTVLARPYLAAQVQVIERVLGVVPDERWVKGDDSSAHYRRPYAAQMLLLAGAKVRHELLWNKCLAGTIGEAERSITDGETVARLSRTSGNAQCRSPQSGTNGGPERCMERHNHHLPTTAMGQSMIKTSESKDYHT